MEPVAIGPITNHDDEIDRVPEKVTAQHRCGHCPVVFRSKALLARHARQLHQPAKKFQCPHCDAAYNSSKNFALHRAAIHGPKPFKCPKCSITFRRHATLVGHIERHYVSEDHICAVCDSEFQSLDELKVHVYEGHEEGLKKKHATKKINIAASTDKRTFKCNLCEDKVFAKRSLLERHFLVHTKQKPFVCDVCGKAFNQRSTLKTHSLVHSKIQEFICLLCGLKFSQKVNLRVHMLRVHPKRTASLAGRLPCPYCPCLFKKLGSLNAHKTKVHAALLAEATKIPKEGSQGNSPRKDVECTVNVNTSAPGIVYKCGSCGMNFNDMVQLSKHMRVHSNDVHHYSRRLDHHAPEIVQPVVASRSQDHLQGANEQRRYPCTICPAAFKKSSHLKQHHKSHYGIKGNRCGICDKTFTTSHTLKVHCNSHSQNSQLHYKCDQCPTSFSLQSSLRRHQKLHEHPDRSYSCPYCNRTFKWFQNCRTHIKASHSEVAGSFLEPIVNSSDVGGTNSAQPEETIPSVEVPEMLIDLSNLPSNVSIVDISNLTNCIVKIDDQLYELPVQIETNHPLNDGIGSTESDFVELPSGEVIIQDCGQMDESNKLNTSDGSLYQYMNETSGEGFSQEEVPNDVDMTILPGGDANPTNQQQSRPKDSKIPNKTEQDLFAELVEDGKKKYSCKGCRKVFKKPVDLRRHIRTHTGERPFRCDQCSKGFTLKTVLQSHLKTHEAQREMVPCPEKGCSSKFSSKTSLELHRRIHTGVRPFQCGVCTLTFRTSGHMQAHMTSHERLAKRREQTNFELLYQE
ncbi:zinc finger protein 236-like [Ochlerotatus camptorhynchus]|uniref:zinc finger protein 236-like n=1 Tax=Ochlerotatus camptorhynchus TaxID=644619 RepID=UPI0031D205EF